MEELTAILTEIRAGQNYSGATNFFNEGLLDSLDMTALVASLESRYNVFFDVEEIVPENFCSLKAISALLSRKGISL
jgi:acyl carrier protein